MVGYQPYDGPVVDLDKDHFHRWHLGQSTYTGVDGKPWRTLAYLPAFPGLLQPGNGPESREPIRGCLYGIEVRRRRGLPFPL